MRHLFLSHFHGGIMASELETCAAAFFRIKGKDTVTVNEFKMTVTFESKWMSVKEAESLLSRMVSENLVTKTGDYLKASAELAGIQVPMAYRPSDSFKRSLTSEAVAEPPKKTMSQTPQKDVFAELVGAAVEKGMQKAKFVSDCNILRKSLNVDTSVAALIILREDGVDIKKWIPEVYAHLL